MSRDSCPHCGGDVNLKPRSARQHRRFFKVVSLAYQHWPLQHQFQPRGSEHLRARLLVEAGWKDEKEVSYVQPRKGRRPHRICRLRRQDDEHAIWAAVLTLRAVMNEFDKHIWVRVDVENQKIIGVMPKSIAYLISPKMNHLEACAVFNRVDEIICATLGIENTDRLILEHGRAA